MKAKITGKEKAIPVLRDTFISKKVAFEQGQPFKLPKAKNYLPQASATSLKWNMLVALCILAAIFTNQVNAQQDNDFLLKKNQFRVGIGASYLKTVDFQYSPNLFQSLKTNLQLGYTNRFKKGIFTTDLNVFVGTLSPASGPNLDFYIQETDIYGAETTESNQVELSPMGFNFEIGYLHPLSKLTTTKTTLYLGGSLEESFNYTPGFVNIGTINYLSFNAKARFDYMLGNGKPIRFGLSVPLISVVTRMPYHNAPNIPGKSAIAGFFTGNNTIETIHHFQNFRLSAKYYLLVREKFALDIAGDLSWLHYDRPEHLTQAGSQLSLGFTF